MKNNTKHPWVYSPPDPSFDVPLRCRPRLCPWTVFMDTPSRPTLDVSGPVSCPLHRSRPRPRLTVSDPPISESVPLQMVHHCFSPSRSSHTTPTPIPLLLSACPFHQVGILSLDTWSSSRLCTIASIVGSLRENCWAWAHNVLIFLRHKLPDMFVEVLLLLQA